MTIVLIVVTISIHVIVATISILCVAMVENNVQSLHKKLKFLIKSLEHGKLP